MIALHSNFFFELDPDRMDPHYFLELDPDPNPHESEKLDQDPHKIQNSEASDAQKRAVEGHGH